MINTLKRIFQQVTLRQLISVCLAGMLMLTSVACSTSRANVPSTSNPSTTGQGMYPHKDTTRDTSAADAKADAAVKQAEQRRQKVKGAEDYFEEVEPGKKVADQAEDLTQSAKRAAKNTAQNTQAGVENLKQNTQKAAEKAANAVDQAT